MDSKELWLQPIFIAKTEILCALSLGRALREKRMLVETDVVPLENGERGASRCDCPSG